MQVASYQISYRKVMINLAAFLHHKDPEESIHLRYTEPTPSSPTAQVYEDANSPVSQFETWKPANRWPGITFPINDLVYFPSQ